MPERIEILPLFAHARMVEFGYQQHLFGDAWSYQPFSIRAGDAGATISTHRRQALAQKRSMRRVIGNAVSPQ